MVLKDKFNQQERQRLHMYTREEQGGWIEVVCGSMFSGKTEELIRRIKRAVIARQVVQVFKPSLDDRYDAVQVASHNGTYYSAAPVQGVDDMRAHLKPEAEVIAIDEAQF